MTWELGLTLLTVTALFIGFVRQVAEVELLALVAVAVLLAGGILTIADVLSAFANPAAMTVAAMFILSAALDKTGVIDVLGKWVLKAADRNTKLALGGLLVTVFLGSFFINNTSVVLIMIPIIIRLAQRLKLASSKLLLPLSYVAILGGACTLIGTSTSLLVDGVAQEMGFKPFGMFDILVPGLSLAAVGGLYMAVVGHRLLPDRQSLSDSLGDKVERRYMSQILIEPGSPLIGKTVPGSGLAKSDEVEILQHISSSDQPVPLATLLKYLDVSRVFRKLSGVSVNGPELDC